MPNEALLKKIQKAKASGATELNLRGEDLKELPLEIGQLTNLTDLNLSGNQLTELPPELFHLTKLTRLNLSQNDLTELPQEICKLINLTALYLGGNQLTKLPPEICQLTGLTRLSLSGNKLTALPSDIIHLIGLVKISLRGNQLTQLPPEIIQLPNLNDLDIRRNKLTELPPELFHLPKLETLELNDNPLISPPYEIAIQGLEAIRTYFADLKGETQLVNEVKLLLVGEGAAGKTSLVKRLLGEDFNPEEDITHGIKISSWQAETGKKKIKVNIWDFGGQEIMHATHQFFLSKRSLYVLVLDGRKGERPEYWLRHIETFGEGSPVLIVINKQDDQHGFFLDKASLQDKYPFIRDVHYTSCKTGTGIVDFKAALLSELAHVPTVETLWSTKWFRVKQQIEEMKEPYISWDQYETLCRKTGINEGISQNVLVDFLHELGVAVHFRDRALVGTHILNPAWATTAVYKIITAQEKDITGGILLQNNVAAIVNQPDGTGYLYTVTGCAFIISMMEKFELCYRLDNERLLIPQRLPETAKSFPLDKAPLLQFILVYEDFLPLSILPRFIVKSRKDIKVDHCWRTGAILENGDFQAKAVVRADGDKRRISITVTGQQCKDYLAVLLYFFREINGRFEKLNVSERIPMPDDPNITADYQTLLNSVKDGIERCRPDGAKRAYNVKELLGLVQFNKQDDWQERILDILERIEGQVIPDKTSLAEELNRIITIHPSWFGVGININAIISLLLAWRKEQPTKQRRNEEEEEGSSLVISYDKP